MSSSVVSSSIAACLRGGGGSGDGGGESLRDAGLDCGAESLRVQGCGLVIVRYTR